MTGRQGKHLFCFGCGYTAGFLAESLFSGAGPAPDSGSGREAPGAKAPDFGSGREASGGWKISGTTTDPDKKNILKQHGIRAHIFDRQRAIPDPFQTFEDITHVLFSVPPDAEGDPVFDVHGEDLAALKNLKWAGYLSTTAVYGNQDGNWIDETTPPSPDTRRGSLRLKAEQQWQSLYLNAGLPLHIFRLSGIYGPGRSAIEAVRSGTATRIEKPGHAFNRIHVADIVQALVASMHAPKPGSIYNLADDAPTPSHEVVQFACNLLGLDVPPLIPYDRAEMPPIVRSFYKDNKRIRNDRIKSELGVSLLYPDYRAGLQACLAADKETLELQNFTGSDVSAG